jgi:hypothetical protein
LNYDCVLPDESNEVETSSLKGIGKVCKGRKQEKRLCIGRWTRRMPSAAKADPENTLDIAAVNRCATQRQVQPLIFRHAGKRFPDTKRAFFRGLPMKAACLEITTES